MRHDSRPGGAASFRIQGKVQELTSQQARERLDATLASLGLQGVVPGDRERLLAYLALLLKWNRTYNLTAVRDPAEMLTHHLADCLAVVDPLRRELAALQGGHPAGGCRRLLDVGSGGGLPGVVLAILCPDLDVTCVDTVGKKAAFIRQVVAELELRNLHASHSRVEDLPGEGWDVIASRAFASLQDFVSLSRSQLAPGGIWMAMKGRRPDDEVAALPPDVEVFHVEHLAVPGLEAERCLVWIRPAAPAGRP